MPILRSPRSWAAAGAVALAVSLLTPSAQAAPARDAATSVDPYCAPAVAHGPAGEPVTPTSAVRGCRYAVGEIGRGPVVAVTSQGVLFVVIGGGNVLRSTDRGRTWTPVPVPPLANGDQGASHAYLHVDPRTDRLWHVASTQVASCGSTGPVPALNGAVVSWSDDLGSSWHGRTVTCETYDWGRLVTGPAPRGNPYPSAVYFLGVGKRLVGGERPVFRSLDGGRSWERMANLASATTEAGAGVTAADGTIYFEYPEFIGFDPTRIVNQTYPFEPRNLCKQMVAVSEDFGQTWRQEAIPGSFACRTGTGNQKVAVDRAGTVYALWTDDLDGRLRMVVSRDKAHTWSRPVDLMPPGTTYNNLNANIVAAAPGHVFITGQHTTSPVNPKPFLNNGVGDWHSWITRSSNAASAHPRFESVDLDPSSDPTYTTGEGPPEMEGYLATNASGQAYGAFVRHSSFGAGQTAGQVWVARFAGTAHGRLERGSRP